jgi:two-component system phosphate regulon sensor histidine kinase PhoR
MIENGIAKENDVKGFAKKITVQSQRLLRIIEDIIRLSEFDEGNAKRDYTTFDLHGMVISTVDALREKAKEKNIDIKIEGDFCNIAANQRMMDELVYNIIENAIKYNKEGGSVFVKLNPDQGFCKLEVTDTGIGIPGEHINRIFERFYIVDASRSKKTGGTGLGLSIVKHITEHHGGKVTLKSVYGQGTTVTCWV